MTRAVMCSGVAATALVALAACALSPPTDQPAFKPQVTTTGIDSKSRDRARIHTELAANYFDAGNIGVALEEVREALRAEPEYGPAYNVSGLIYAELKEDKLAQDNFQQALRLDPLDSDANNNYGRFLCDRKRTDDAVRYFLAALRNPLYKTPERSYVNAGVCLRRGGDSTGAEDYFNKALKLQAGQPQALYQLADMAYSRRQYPQAKEYLIRLEQVSPANPEVLWLAVRLERKLGDRDAAASYSMQLTRNFPQSKEARALQAGIDE
jgi:type IV pilus assembly protein PilF